MATATLDKRAEAAIKTAQTKNLIGGKWVNALSGRTFATYNPATEDVIAHVAEGDRDDIDMAVAAGKTDEDDALARLDEVDGQCRQGGSVRGVNHGIEGQARQ